MRKYLFISIVLISSSCKNQTSSPVIDSPKPPVEKDIFTALKEQSKSEGKNLFLVFSMRGCAPCIIFERYHNDSVVKTILSKYVIVRKIDVNKTPGGSELYKKYWKMGLPLWVLVNSEGEVIVDSGDPCNNSISYGYPHNTKAIKFYINALKKTAPAIEQEECEILKKKLIEYYVKK